ncbi:MAG: hypothetical protein ACLQDL_08245 [Spirochaetia bacterium]
MVRILGRFMGAAAVTLSLASCIFGLTAFPPTLTQVLARADLSSVIPAGDGSQYQVYIVTPTGGEFVILLNTSGSMDPAAVIMDSSLHLIQTYTLAQFGTWFITSGSTLMTDAAGNVALKDHYFAASDLTTINQAPSGTLNAASLNGPGFCSPASSNNDVDFQVAGGNLTYTQYNSVWLLPFPRGPFQVSSTGANYQVVAVYDVDDTPAAGEVVLVLNDMSNNMYFVAIPLVTILSGAVTPFILSNYPYVTLTNYSNSSIGFTGDSLVAYNYNSNSLVRFSAKPPFNQLSSLSQGNNNGKNNGNIQYAYKMTGGYSVVFDQVARKLTKVANWW